METQGTVATGLELMPGVGRNLQQIAAEDSPDPAPQIDPALSPADPDHMDVGVALEGGMTTGPHFEVAQLKREILASGEEDLSGDGTERVPVLLVGEEGNALPAVAGKKPADHGL